MASGSPEGVTQLLERWSQGDEEALGQLMPLVYSELHRLAGAYLRRERREHTLQPTALINETYLKLIDQDHPNWKNRAQFFGVAAQLMRRILVDHARRHHASKRGGDRLNVSLRNIGAFGNQPDADLLTLHDALDQLEKIDPEQSRLVELRFFGGLTIEETAEVMQISHATVEREWKIARAWLKREFTKTTAVS
ncbi:MAG TPA: sigma-70 family RNA polymerase sigma factor [Pyrinomonadaceae bacterium]|jgi:RNA polymerase sigma factor (TIGR02999 family)|nr:sigma-70 family RNA polymerase sigma factor [Pyrinomonadaceae bacterium]